MVYSNSFENNISRSDQKKLDKCRDLLMIGRLTRELYPTKPTAQGSIQILIDSLCDDPDPVIDLGISDQSRDIYIGFDEMQSQSYLPPYYDINSFDEGEKQDQLEEYYENKLIVFHPYYSRNSNSWFKNLMICGLFDDNLDEYFSFKSVPRVSMETQKFEQILKKGDFFSLIGFDGEIMNSSPDMILCGSYVYKLKNEFKDEELLTVNTNVYDRWKCVNYNHLVKLDITNFEDYKTSVIRASDSCVFIEDNLYSAIVLSDDYVPMEEDKIQQLINSQAEKLKKKEIESKEDEEDEDGEFELDKEIQFLSGLKQLTMDNGLQYKETDLYNFHISVKTNPLTILAGMSGTGKSRLAMNYAKMLDLSEDNNTLLFLPITPSYTEPSDVLGYLNSMNGLYVPSETGLVQFLLQANDNPDQMHMVIFDEMNLSQVEYWFSPFISILEKDKNERILKLYDSDAHCINEKVYPPSVKIGENIIFVGTVNIDDTTKNFSDRLLDRTFVINLGMVTFEEFYDAYVKYTSSNEKADVIRSKCKDVNEFVSWCHGDDRHYMEAFKNNPRELEFLDRLSVLIKKYIPSGGISHRVMKNIGNYILNVPVDHDEMIIERKEVFDIVVNQTVLTKIRGTETQLLKLIGTFDYDANQLIDSELISLFDEFEDVSEFELTKNSLITKAEEIRINGYTN